MNHLSSWILNSLCQVFALYCVIGLTLPLNAQNPRGDGTGSDPYFYTFQSNGYTHSLTRWQEEVDAPPILAGDTSSKHYFIEQYDENLVETANLDKVQYRENYDSYRYDIVSPRLQGLHTTSGSTSMDLRTITGSLKAGGVYREDTESHVAQASMTCAANGDVGMVKGNANDREVIELANGNIQDFNLSTTSFDFDFSLGGNNGGVWSLELLGIDHGHHESDVCESFNGDFNNNQFIILTNSQRVHGSALGMVFANGVQEYVDLVYGFPSPLSIYLPKWDEDFFKPFEPS